MEQEQLRAMDVRDQHLYMLDVARRLRTNPPWREAVAPFYRHPLPLQTPLKDYLTSILRIPKKSCQDCITWMTKTEGITTLATLLSLYRRAGKVRAISVSCFTQPRARNPAPRPSG
jgi:hypothetical protein